MIFDLLFFLINFQQDQFSHFAYREARGPMHSPGVHCKVHQFTCTGTWEYWPGFMSILCVCSLVAAFHCTLVLKLLCQGEKNQHTRVCL